MSIDDETFFSENLTSINKMVSKILLLIIPLPLFLIALSHFGIFSISDVFSFRIFVLALIFYLVFQLLIMSNIRPKVTMAVGLLEINLFIAVVGTNSKVGVYITFGLVPIISCLYYNRKLTNIIGIFSYIFMEVSLFFKFKNGAALFDNSTEMTFLGSYIPIAAGFTLEFFFVLLTANLMSKRGFVTLKHLLSLIDDRNGLIETLREKQSKLHNTQEKIIEFVTQSLKSHDLLTGFHVEHTQTYVRMIAKKLRALGYYKDELTDETINLYADAAFLHDIGKIHTPEGILNKPGKFTDEEFAIMKRHPKDGADLIRTLPIIGDGEFNNTAYEIALYHHEKWDGSGYPSGKAGVDIPLCARIMAAADVMDALISLRTYKKPMSIEKAMMIFEDSKGSQFEPCIVDAVIACKDEIMRKDAEFKAQEAMEFDREVTEKHQYNELLKIQILEKVTSECESQNFKEYLEGNLKKLKSEYDEKYNRKEAD